MDIQEFQLACCDLDLKGKNTFIGRDMVVTFDI